MLLQELLFLILLNALHDRNILFVSAVFPLLRSSVRQETDAEDKEDVTDSSENQDASASDLNARPDAGICGGHDEQ